MYVPTWFLIAIVIYLAIDFACAAWSLPKALRSRPRRYVRKFRTTPRAPRGS